MTPPWSAPDITYEVQFKDVDGGTYAATHSTPADDLLGYKLQSGSTLNFQTEHIPISTFGPGRTFNYQVRATTIKAMARGLLKDPCLPTLICRTCH